jgi:hypothetical protein
MNPHRISIVERLQNLSGRVFFRWKECFYMLQTNFLLDQGYYLTALELYLTDPKDYIRPICGVETESLKQQIVPLSPSNAPEFQKDSPKEDVEIILEDHSGSEIFELAVKLLVLTVKDIEMDSRLEDPVQFCTAFHCLRTELGRKNIKLDQILQHDYFRYLDKTLFKVPADERDCLKGLYDDLKNNTEPNKLAPKQREIITYVTQFPLDESKDLESFASRVADYAQLANGTVSGRVNSEFPYVNGINSKGFDRILQKLKLEQDFFGDTTLAFERRLPVLKDLFRGSVTLTDARDHFEDLSKLVSNRSYSMKLRNSDTGYCAIYISLNIDDLSYELQVIPESVRKVKQKAHDWYTILRYPTVENLYGYLDKVCKRDMKKRKADLLELEAETPAQSVKEGVDD